MQSFAMKPAIMLDILLTLGVLALLLRMQRLRRQQRVTACALTVDGAGVERINRLYLVLAQLNRAITRITDREQLLNAACRILVEVGGFRVARLMQYSTGERALVPVAQHASAEAVGDSQPCYPVDDSPQGHSPSATAFRTGQPFVSNELFEERACIGWREVFVRFGYHSCVALPLSTDERICGSLSVYAPQSGIFRAEELALLQSVANDLSHALDTFAHIERQRARDAAAELVVRREMEFSAALIHSTPGTLCVFNRDGRYLRWNHRLVEVSGYRDEEIARMDPLEFFAPQDRERIRARIATAFATGYAEVEAGLVTRDGRSIPYLFTGQRTLLEGMPCLISVGIDISVRRSIEARLAERTLQLQHTSHRLMEVQENERRRLARELHDSVGQELTALSLNLAAIGTRLGAQDTQLLNRLTDSQSLLEHTTQHLREVMMELRPPGLDELGLFAALKEHAIQVSRRSNIALDIAGGELLPRLSPAREIALFRIAQEALNNAVKHAGARCIGLQLQDGRPHARLEIADDGIGFDSRQHRPYGMAGMGMTTMRERAEAIGGRLQLHSRPGQGTRIVVEIPRDAGQPPCPSAS